MIDQTTAVQFLVTFAALLFAVLAFVAVRRVESKTTNPNVGAFLTALNPYLNEALYGAASLAERALQSAQVKLEAVDKKAIADGFYALLPDTIMVDGRIVPVGEIKSVVSQAQWESMVAHALDLADSRIIRNETWLLTQVQKLSPTPALVTPPPMPMVVNASATVPASVSVAKG
jgi:hypothetical protein